jgi:predicted NAD/FAD-binding protein
MTSEGLRELRRIARQLGLPASALDAALECGLFLDEEPVVYHQRSLRQVRRLMRDLGVNSTGAVLIVRLRREVESLQIETRRLRRRTSAGPQDWLDAVWRELDEG